MFSKRDCALINSYDVDWNTLPRFSRYPEYIFYLYLVLRVKDLYTYFYRDVAIISSMSGYSSANVSDAQNVLTINLWYMFIQLVERRLSHQSYIFNSFYDSKVFFIERLFDVRRILGRKCGYFLWQFYLYEEKLYLLYSL